MTGLTFRFRTVMVVAAAGLIGFGALAACAGPTSVDIPAQTGAYRVGVKTDPLTLNPPARGTITYGVTDAKTSKPVVAFENVSGALMHNVLISKDLTYFNHTFTDRLVSNEASIFTYWPMLGTYYTYAIYKPQGAAVQVFTTTITAGTPTGPVQLQEDTGPKFTGSVRVDFLKSPDTLKAGQPAQLVFHLTERGQPVTALWPYLNAPGHLWVVDKDGGSFAHELATSEMTRFIPEPTPDPSQTPSTLGSTPETSTGTNPNSGANMGVPAGSDAAGSAGTGTGTDTGQPQQMPTFAPSIAQALATVAATTPQPLLPVQQTAQASITGGQDVPPAVGYGPDLVFSHTFPRPGIYKLWVEMQYRAQVIQVGFAVRVVP
ncbi:MAG: hypothetical protein IVW55_10765 [Chloroflexi bacterium]|nr:hypothetical protein [Chloroflexota bacterium]